jgi:hypothetical protein
VSLRRIAADRRTTGKFLQTLEFAVFGRHPGGVGKLIERFRARRRDRRLAHQLELRYRAFLNERAAAAARITDDLRRDRAPPL